MSNTVFTVSPSPKSYSNTSVQGRMRDVLIALLPAAIAGVYYLKVQALFVILVSVVTCVAAEAIWQKATGQDIRINDLSAAVTGLLLALNLPATVPLWIPVVGGAFAIIFVKQFFGGLGQNFMNPTLAARAFLLASWAGAMSTVSTDTAASASQEAGQTLWQLLMGPTGSYIGEVSVLALLIGGAYLLIRRVITLRIPLAFIGTTFILSWLLGENGLMTGNPVTGILSGAVMLGAFFMATDPSSSPTMKLGQYIMGVGCGILTTVFRVYGNNPESFIYAILIMNLFVPFIEKYTTPQVAPKAVMEVA